MPWLFVARAGYQENTSPLESVAAIGPRFAQFVVESASVTPLLGLVILVVVLGLWRRRSSMAAGRPQRPIRKDDGGPLAERSLVLMLTGTIVAYAVVMAFTQSAQTIWVVGMRQTPAVLPFVAMLTALAVATASQGHWRPWLALMILFGFTKLGDLTPWTFWQRPTPSFDASTVVTFHNPPKLIDRIFRTDEIAYLASIVRPNPGTIARTSEFLRERAKPGDILITNYEWEPLYFHTRLPQGLTILPSYPIYETARAKGLPSYVYSADGVRWIVWRRTWGPYRGQACDQILKALMDAGIRVEQVATISETLWENRENIHFRRFAGGRYIYPWFENVPDTLIFRVDWPTQTR